MKSYFIDDVVFIQTGDDVISFPLASLEEMRVILDKVHGEMKTWGR